MREGKARVVSRWARSRLIQRSELEPFGVHLVPPGRSPETRLVRPPVRTDGIDHEAYADLVKSVFARFAEPGPITHAPDVAEIRHHPDSPSGLLARRTAIGSAGGSLGIARMVRRRTARHGCPSRHG